MAGEGEEQIRVWDPVVRLFHWGLVISFFVAYLSGEESLRTHVYAGYVIVFLLAVRVVWGFIGTPHARFSDFVYPPRETFAYLKSLASGHPKRYLGHNPAGGLMVILLLISLALTSITGLLLDETYEVTDVGPGIVSVAVADEDEDDEEYEGSSHHEEEMLEELHEILGELTLFLVFIHIAGVLVSSRLHHENLVRAMITGKKPAEPRS